MVCYRSFSRNYIFDPLSFFKSRAFQIKFTCRKSTSCVEGFTSICIFFWLTQLLSCLFYFISLQNYTFRLHAMIFLFFLYLDNSSECISIKRLQLSLCSSEGDPINLDL